MMRFYFTKLSDFVLSFAHKMSIISSPYYKGQILYFNTTMKWEHSFEHAMCLHILQLGSCHKTEFSVSRGRVDISTMRTHISASRVKLYIYLHS